MHRSDRGVAPGAHRHAGKSIGHLAAALLSVGLASCQTNIAQTWPTPPGASTQVVNGYPLTYRARGAGPTVVFVGGVLTDYRVWDQALSSWESQFRVVAVSPRHFFPKPETSLST